MPYINQAQRAYLDPEIIRLIYLLSGGSEDTYKTGHIPATPMNVDGPTNYVITRIVDALYGHGNYAQLARGIGLLEAVKAEFYRRRVTPYEDKKCIENGDVY